MTSTVQISAPLIPGFSWNAQQPNDSDDAFVSRALAGDKKAFGNLVERYSQRVFRACMAITKNHDAAEDCLQRTFMQALNNLPQYRGEAQFSTWLTRIALNVALSHLRQTARRPATVSVDDEISSLNLIDRSQNPEASCYRKEIRKLLERALESLSPRLRLVFVLRDVEEITTEETSRILGITESAVKTRLVRARLKLRERLQPALMTAMELFSGVLVKAT